MSIKRVNEIYDEFATSNNKVKSIVDFRRAIHNTFYEMAFTLSDEEKINLMEFYSFDKSIVTNLICKLSNDELKINAMRKFEITDTFLIQVIINSLNTYDNQVALINEFNLNDYCAYIIDSNSDKKKL